MALKAPEPVDYAKAIHQSFPFWLKTFGEVMATKIDACTTVCDPDGVWRLVLVLFRGDGVRVQSSVPINPNGGPIINGEVMTKWGFVQLAPFVWALIPSINSSDYHGFVVVRGVPEPTPWVAGIGG